MPGTRPVVARAMLVIFGPPSTNRSVTVASVCTDSAVCPAWARMFDKAIEKQDACAAAMSCSGVAPGAVSEAGLEGVPAGDRVPGGEGAGARGQVTLPFSTSLSGHEPPPSLESITCCRAYLPQPPRTAQSPQPRGHGMWNAKRPQRNHSRG